VIPPSANALAVLRVDHTQGTMADANPATSGQGFDLDLHVIVGWIRHEHWATQFQQGGSFDYLYEPPQVSDPVAAIPVPPATWFWLKEQLQRFAIRSGIALSEAMQDRREGLFRRGFEIYVLLNIECQVFQSHDSSLLGTK